MAKIYGNTTTTPIKPDLFGGEKITVEQTYNPESENAQSGKAVAEAISGISGGGTADMENYYTKEEINDIVGDIETLLGGI